MVASREPFPHEIRDTELVTQKRHLVLLFRPLHSETKSPFIHMAEPAAICGTRSIVRNECVMWRPSQEAS